jgi:hypothetical protein
MQIDQDDTKRKPAPDRASLLAVYDGRSCIGFLLRHGPAGVEGFDQNNNSLGIHENDDAAAAAVWRAARGSGA